MINPLSYAGLNTRWNSHVQKKPIPLQATQLTFGQAKRTKEAKPLTNDDYRRMYHRDNGATFYGSHKDVSAEEARFLAGFSKALVTAMNPQTGKNFHLVSPAGPGAMKVMSETAFNAGGHVVGAAMNFEGEESEVAIHPEYYMHPSFESRIVGKGGYIDRGARTMAGTGGWGTLKELLDLGIRITNGQIPAPTQKAVALMDYNKFYSQEGGFLSFMDFLAERGALPKGFEPRKFYIPVQTPEEMMEKVFLKNKREIPWAKPNKAIPLHRDPYSHQDKIKVVNGIVVAKPGNWETVEAVLDIAQQYFYEQGKAGFKRKVLLVDTDNFYSKGLLKHLQFLVDQGKAYPQMMHMYEVHPTMESAEKRAQELSDVQHNFKYEQLYRKDSGVQFGSARPRLHLVG